MNISELTARYRLESGDRKKPGLLTDPEVLRYLIEGETEACRRGLIIRDASTTAVCQVAVTADEPWLTVDSRVVKIATAELWTPSDDDPDVIVKRELHREHQRDLPRGWRDEAGDPCALVTDVELDRLRLYPTPTHDGTLHLSVVRLPLDDMTTEPEIPAKYHSRLVDWVIYKAYANADPELYDRQLAADALARFEAAFGPPVSANDDLWIGNRSNPQRRRTRFF